MPGDNDDGDYVTLPGNDDPYAGTPWAWAPGGSSSAAQRTPPGLVNASAFVDHLAQFRLENSRKLSRDSRHGAPRKCDVCSGVIMDGKSRKLGLFGGRPAMACGDCWHRRPQDPLQFLSVDAGGSDTVATPGQTPVTAASVVQCLDAADIKNAIVGQSAVEMPKTTGALLCVRSRSSSQRATCRLRWPPSRRTHVASVRRPSQTASCERPASSTEGRRWHAGSAGVAGARARRSS